jgi:hypothetical protein
LKLKAFSEHRLPFREQIARQFAAPISTSVARGRLMAAYSRIGQSMAALRKTPDLYSA